MHHMKHICIILVLVITLGEAILSTEEEWQQFKSLHNKLYQSSEEEAYRFGIFKNNLEKIREHNEKYERGETTYKMGINQFSDLTFEEFERIYGKGLLNNDDGKL
ncbi:hypothetical protein ABEB36_010298 [Hypothenemus hampei]|uniref:Cathepsin propeptide inhibitor domain-containing protein n=1 Tax=Hypothenemus hampei TaxID=57062 RepID=A0ABD1EJ73_HYPHA